MIIRTLGEIARIVSGTVVNGSPSIVVKGVSKDTRTIEQGNLYVPIIGMRFDGHSFAGEAFRLGASASFWQRDHEGAPEGVPLVLVDDALEALQQLAAAYRQQLPVKIVGVTGSNGKTTTKDMISSVLSVKYRVHKTEGNLNTDIGLPLTILQMDEQTEYAVLEMGMRGFGEIELLTKIARPDAAVITMIGEAHLERLGSREGIARAKLEILSGLREDGLFVYNGDEPLLEQFLPNTAKPAGMRTIRFGWQDGNDLVPEQVRVETGGTRFLVKSEPGIELNIPIPGRHNVLNALAAMAIGKHFGLSAEEIASGLHAVRSSGMRIELEKAPSGLTIINDAYNASPSSTRAAIQLLAELEGYRNKIAILGDMLELGEREAEYHRQIGKLLQPEKIGYLFAYGPLSKHTAEAAAETYPPGRVFWFADKEQLAAAAANVAGPQDAVLVKGSRGMSLEEVVDRLKRHSR